MSGAKKSPARAGTMTADERRFIEPLVRRELLTFALAWYIRRAQRLGADVLPLFSNGPERVDLWLKQHEQLGETASDERAADILWHYGLIPRQRKRGPKETYSQETMRRHLLQKFDLLLRKAQAINGSIPRNLTNADEINRATDPPGAWPVLCGIVAEYRKKRRGAHALAGLLAAHVLRGDPDTAVARLAALRKVKARRPNSPR